MGALLTPAFLLFLPVTPSVCSKPTHNSRRRVCMASDNPTKPSNVTPALVPQTTRSVPSGSSSDAVLFEALADEFNVISLHHRLLRKSITGLKVTKHESMLHIARGGSDAFVFPYGCLVVWGGDADREFYEVLIKRDAVRLRPSPILSSRRCVAGGDKNSTRDAMLTETDAGGLDSVLERLAISCALAQSVKLRAVETAIHAAAANTRHISEQLAGTGEVAASRKEVSRLLGILFLERYRYSLSGDILSTPEFLHNNDRYLPCYRRAERLLEVRERGNVLGGKIEVLQEFYRLLGDELTHHYSIGLELAITIMIAFEIFLSLLALARQSLRSMFSACAMSSCVSLIVWGLWGLYRRRSAAVALKKFPRSSNYLKRLTDGLPPGVS